MCLELRNIMYFFGLWGKRKNKIILKSYIIIIRCMEKKIIFFVIEMMSMFGYENYVG